MMEAFAHGGDVRRVARESGIPAERILDFSANVNPLGLPARAAERLAREAREPRLLTGYPDPQASELRAVLARQFAVAHECIAIGAGADSLIHAAVRALAPRRCVIPVPAFSEYERACRAYGCAIRQVPFAAAPQATLEAGDLIILNNPHNPTGACAGRAQMRERVAAARSCGASVLADEAFIDYAPEASVTCDAAAQDRVIAIRSLTKFFGCAGLRVGYAVAAPETARALVAQLPAWPVTTLALNALAEAVQDGEYIRAVRESNQRARARLAAALAQLGCCVFPSAANFLLFELPAAVEAAPVRDRLVREHSILVRGCDSFAGLERGRHLRVAVRREEENARLIEALATILG